MIPIAKYVADVETYKRVMYVLESGQLSQGNQVYELETLVAQASNCKYAVAVSSGTTALEAMLHSVQGEGH